MYYEKYIGKFFKAILKSGDKRFGFLESVDEKSNTLTLKKIDGGILVISVDAIVSCEIEEPIQNGED